MGDVSNYAIQKALAESGMSRKELAAKIGYSKSSVDKVLIGVGSSASRQAVAEALGLVTEDSKDASPDTVADNGQAERAVVPVAQISDDDVMIPGPLVGFATRSGLPLNRIIALSQVYSFLMRAGDHPHCPRNDSEWNILNTAIDPWF